MYHNYRDYIIIKTLKQLKNAVKMLVVSNILLPLRMKMI